MMDDFDTMFPAFTAATAKLYETVTVFTFILAFSGLLWAGWQTSVAGAGINELFRRIMHTGLIAVVTGLLPLWVANTEKGLRKSLVEDLGMNPAATHKKYGELLNAEGIGNSDHLSWWEKLTDPKTSIAVALCSGLMWLISKIAWFIMWLSFIVQKVCLWMGLGIAPVFLGMFLWEVTAGIARNYFIHYFGILLWPLGWGVADLITQGLMGAAAASSGIITEGGAEGFMGGYAAITFCLVLAIWILFSTIAMPVLIAKSLTTGEQIGTAALSRFAGSVAAAGGAAVMASGRGGGAGTSARSSAGNGTGGNSPASVAAGCGGNSPSGGAGTPAGGGPAGGGLIGSGGWSGEATSTGGMDAGGTEGARDVRSVRGGGARKRGGASRIAGAAGSAAGGMTVAAAMAGAFAGQATGVREVSAASAALAGRVSSGGGTDPASRDGDGRSAGPPGQAKKTSKTQTGQPS